MCNIVKMYTYCCFCAGEYQVDGY